ncbi:MAG: ATP-binding cassette domain-containing protein, partial [Pseudolabrys sp.]
MSALLEVKDLELAYGQVAVCRDISLRLDRGEIVALIGANGAGKSTLMMTVFGNPRASKGEIRFAGRDITAMATHEIAKLRIAQSP